MNSRRKKPPRSPSPLADAKEARPPVAALWARPWLLGGMTSLLVARPLFPRESAD